MKYQNLTKFNNGSTFSFGFIIIIIIIYYQNYIIVVVDIIIIGIY